MKKRILLSVNPEIRDYDSSDRPSHFYLEVTQKMANRIFELSRLLVENKIDEITTQSVVEQAVWGVIDAPDTYDSLKMAAFELKQAPFKVGKASMIVTEEGFYFKVDRSHINKPNFRTELIAFSELENSKSIIL